MGNIIPEKYYKIFLYGILAILVLPVINIQPWLSPPAWGKTILFRIIISILIWFFTYLIISKKDNNTFVPIVKNILLNRKNNKVFWILWLLIVFSFLVSLSTFFSQDSHFSFWGSPQRAGGSLNLLLYILFAFLAFLIIKEKDWPKVWFFVLGTGFLVSLIAVLQRFQLFNSILIPQTDQAVSTMGSPIILGIYLTLLVFISLSFAIKNTDKRRIFYFLCFILFASNIILSGSRASALGFVIGLPFFALLYPGKNKKIKIFKIITGGFFILMLLGLFWLNNNEMLQKAISENPLGGRAISRVIGASKPFFDLKNFSPEKLISDTRPSGWNIALQGIKERPILGFGPENFSIVFDKYYSSHFGDLEIGSWWDRAHSFVFEMASTMGVPALIIYLAVFAAIFWQLQKIKYKENCQDATIINGIQTTLIAYFTSLLFGFDDFSTYIVLFALISYSLFIILKYNPIELNNKISKQSEAPLWKSGINFGIFICLIFFLWIGEFQPLYINKEINMASHYSNTERNCQKAINTMEKKISSSGILNAYFRLSYVDIINRCENINPESRLSLNLRLQEILREATRSMPTYTRAWWFLGSNTKFLIANKENYSKINKDFEIIELEKEGEICFKKAAELSPERWTIIQDWAAFNVMIGQYEKAINKSRQCLLIKSEAGECFWIEALANISLGNIKKGELLKKIAEKTYVTDQQISLNEYVQAYSRALEVRTSPAEKKEIYLKISTIYKRLMDHYNKFQYHASLAYVYKELGEYEKAGEEAMSVFALNPGSVSTIEEFLDSLPKSQNYYQKLVPYYEGKLLSLEKEEYEPKYAKEKEILESQYHGILAFLYVKTNNKTRAKEEALLVKKLNPDIAIQVDVFIKSLK